MNNIHSIVTRTTYQGETFALILGTATPFFIAKMRNGKWIDVPFGDVPPEVVKVLAK